jgi:hypothetical protein
VEYRQIKVTADFDCTGRLKSIVSAFCCRSLVSQRIRRKNADGNFIALTAFVRALAVYVRSFNFSQHVYTTQKIIEFLLFGAYLRGVIKWPAAIKGAGYEVLHF